MSTRHDFSWQHLLKIRHPDSSTILARRAQERRTARPGFRDSDVGGLPPEAGDARNVYGDAPSFSVCDPGPNGNGGQTVVNYVVF